METVILTGPKHSGKSTVGKKLALFCSCVFLDIDDLIFQRTGKSPRQLFNEGQVVFQKAEAEAIAALFCADSADATSADSTVVDERRVIATGGGIIDNAEAAALLKKSGARIVYLNISAEGAWDRIAAEGELPPFLRTENPRETHRVLHERRAAAYLQFADIVVNVEGKSADENAAEIFKRLG